LQIIDIPVQCFKFEENIITFKDEIHKLLENQGSFRILNADCDYIMTNLCVPVYFETLELAMYFKLMESRWAKMPIPNDFLLYSLDNIRTLFEIGRMDGKTKN